jgi:hypothetical protein
MTETDWLTATDLRPMLGYLRGKACDRKLRLFAVACCRRVWHLIEPHTEIRACVEFGEEFADGTGAQKRLKKMTDACRDRYERYGGRAGEDVSVAFAGSAARATCQPKGSWQMVAASGSAGWAIGGDPQADWPAQADILRCIFGNPFRPVVFDPRWRSEAAVTLAAGIYADRAFDRLPILADALEEAGCDHPDILTHCRGPGPHARGCWVVDGVLGKE